MVVTILVCAIILIAITFLAISISAVNSKWGGNRPWLLWVMLVPIFIVTTIYIINRWISFSESTLKLCIFISAMSFAVWVFLDVLLKHTFQKSSWLMRAIFALLCGAAIYYPLIPSIMEQQDINKFYVILLSFYRSARLFFVDGDFPAIQNALSENKELIKIANEGIFFVKLSGKVCYQGLVILAYLWAPITTATFLASIFQNAMAHIRLRTVGLFVKRYIFSELNDKSLALAKDIREKDNGKNFFGIFKSVIVFHDVYRKHEETSTELLDEAKKMGALCFKRDIANLSNGSFPWVKTEYFVIGENESENIKQALSLVKKYKKHSNKKVYVWARSPESVHILDSLQIIDDDASANFVLRRIDDVEIFVWNTLKDAKLFNDSKIYEDKDKQKYISILIVGMGEYGMEFLKTATWMYQFDNIKLEITAIDIKDTAEKTLRYQCPEMMNLNGQNISGEAHYDIKFIKNIDIFTDDLVNMLTPDEKKSINKDVYLDDKDIKKKKFDKDLLERLKRVRQVFVTLGDDDLNIRGAIEMRQLFDVLHYDECVKNAAKSTIKEDDIDKVDLENLKPCDIKEEVYKNTKNDVLKKLAENRVKRDLKSTYTVPKDKEISEQELDAELTKQAKEKVTNYNETEILEAAKTEIEYQEWLNLIKTDIEYDLNKKYDYDNCPDENKNDLESKIERIVYYKVKKLVEQNDAVETCAKQAIKKLEEAGIKNRNIFNMTPEEKEEFFEHEIFAGVVKELRKSMSKELKDIFDSFNKPCICAPVYDIVKTENITKINQGSNQQLRCYENTPYNIDFVGSFEKQYSYKTVVREKLENIALAYHLKWASLDNYDDVVNNFKKYNQYEYYRRSSIAQAMHIQLLSHNVEENGDSNLKVINEITCEQYNKDKGNLTEELISAVHVLKEEMKKYARNKGKIIKMETPQEVKTAIEHLKALDECENIENCDEPKCKRIRRATIEHIRWNAYMRSIGYCAPFDSRIDAKLPRVKVHTDIVQFDKLDSETKKKDGITQ